MVESRVGCKKLTIKTEYLDSAEEIFLEEKAKGPATCNIFLKNSSDVRTRGIHREGTLRK